MGLNKSTQTLRHDLRGIAVDLQWFRLELLRIGEDLSLLGKEIDAQAMLRISTTLLKNATRLDDYVEEVKAGWITRVQPYTEEALILRKDTKTKTEYPLKS
ncbi:hypothetical protein [Pseudomonas corrugata]|uniref:hypothetical protein n=1 Tax=Pseudomonas corrugata TaxID=47879 RepID=UPI001F51E17F|nr:hypothetical protein [Pseudomonas corrugata]